ncbi:hypothetical protein [Mucilaginibacter sp.]
MADYQAHINQAKKNLCTLSEISIHTTGSWDWQVTCSYYVAVHLMNAHIASKANLHYKTHEKVKNALFADLSPCKIDENIYVSYVRLENLSRRARYLCNDKLDGQSDNSITYLTHDVHFKRAIAQLEMILVYFKDLYNIAFDTIKINCVGFDTSNFKYFNAV